MNTNFKPKQAYAVTFDNKTSVTALKYCGLTIGKEYDAVILDTYSKQHFKTGEVSDLVKFKIHANDHGAPIIYTHPLDIKDGFPSILFKEIENVGKSNTQQ